MDPSVPRQGRAAGGGGEAGNAEQKSRGGRGRAMGRQRLLSTLPHTAPRGWELGEAGWEVRLELQETGERSQGGFEVIQRSLLAFPGSFLDEKLFSLWMKRCKG